MTEFRDADLLAKALQQLVCSRPEAVIGVDGGYGSGKSTFAKGLAKAVDGSLVHADAYLAGDARPYREQFDYAGFQAAVKDLVGLGKPVLIEGICLLDLLARVKVKPDLLVYVKKLASSGYWPDEDSCDIERIDLESPMLNGPGSGVAREVADYHLSHNPMSRADFLFVWTTS